MHDITISERLGVPGLKLEDTSHPASAFQHSQLDSISFKALLLKGGYIVTKATKINIIEAAHRLGTT